MHDSTIGYAGKSSDHEDTLSSNVKPMKSATEQALVLTDIHIRLHNRPLFTPLNLTIHPGEVVTLMGPSGCGKSTLLNYICGTLPSAFQAKVQRGSAGGS